MKLKHREIARQAATIKWHLENCVSDVDFLRLKADKIAGRANDDMDDGVRGISYDKKGGRSSGPSDPVGAHLVAGQRDDVAAAASALVAHLAEGLRLAKQAERHLDIAERAGRSLLAIDPKTASELATADAIANKEQTLQAQCANPACGALVAGTPNDRLRGGRCDPCRMYLTRNGLERPRHLCAIGEDMTGSEALGLDDSKVIVSEVA